LRGLRRLLGLAGGEEEEKKQDEGEGFHVDHNWVRVKMSTAFALTASCVLAKPRLVPCLFVNLSSKPP
jgi:hypothetical protein